MRVSLSFFKQRTLIVFFLILLFALFLRTYLLNVLPISMNNDEIDFLVQTKSVSYTFTDLDGTWHPLSLSPLQKEPKSEIDYLLLVPFVALSPLSLLTAHFPYLFFNLGIIILLYFLARKFFSTKTAFAVMFVAATTPWLLYLARTAFESQIAMFFFLLGVTILLYSTRWKILISFTAFACFFYAYMGTKVIFIPLVIVCCFFAWTLQKKQYGRYYAAVFTFSLIIFLFFLHSFITGTEGKRANDVTLSSNTVVTQVKEERQDTIHYPLVNIFSNKYVIDVRGALSRYMGAFSPVILFAQGDPHPLYGFWDNGLFYYTDVVLLLFGIIYTYKRNRKVFYFFLALLLIGPIPSAASQVDISYIHRASITLLIDTIFIGLGLGAIISWTKGKKFGNYYLITFGIIFFVELLNFNHIYLFRNQIYNSIQGAFHNRVLATYTKFDKKQSQNLVIIVPDPYAVYKSYLFYNNLITKDSIHTIQQNFKTGNYHDGSVSFIDNCPTKTSIKANTTYAVYYLKCTDIFSKKSFLQVPSLKDGSAIFKIYNDKVCDNTPLFPYLSQYTLSSFRVEQLPPSTFCQNYITQFQ